MIKLASGKKKISTGTGLGAHCWGSKLSFPPGRAGSLWLFSVQWAADRLNGDGAVREPPYACDACHYACPATTGRCAPVRCRWCRCEGQAWGMRGAVPPAAWAFAILVGSDMLFLRRFSGEFAPFAFSQCDGFFPAAGFDSIMLLIKNYFRALCCLQLIPFL